MNNRYSTVRKKVKGFLHGGDYNPEQWLDYPEILSEDFRLMQLAHCNTFSLNIFGWSAIEPEEGKYNFGWLDDIMDRLAAQGAHVILATPSGARPAWLAQKYPEVLRVGPDRKRNLFGKRHNHCYTSPVYREKTRNINRLLAERYKDHPALIMWHVSNEYGGECHCDLCQEAFRNWLKKKYQSLERLNHEWWTAFWSHTFTDWSQIQSPAPQGENAIHAQNLDWKRFVTDQTIDFYLNEIAPLREVTPDIPVTTNFMGDYPHMGPYLGLDYHKFAKEVDVVSWDAYPAWHIPMQATAELAADVGFMHDLYRSMKKDQPFLVMENTPSLVNWHQVNKMKKPGIHMLSSLQSIAHGADSNLYFQWRKSRGGPEKFHGAVVSHAGHEHTRVFQEVADVGKALEEISEISGTTIQSEAAVIYDWENQWAIDDAQALKLGRKDYIQLCQEYYQSLRKQGISVDVISPEKHLDDYKLIIAPMLYMVRAGTAERLESFVKKGGTLVMTYWSGMVNENDLCFLGGSPGPLRNLLGIWSEEIDSLYDEEKNTIIMNKNGYFPLKGKYEVKDYCEIIHPETAHVLAEYENDFYKGGAALTVKRLKHGEAYYMAAHFEQKCLDDFYRILIEKLQLQKVLNVELPDGVSVSKRTGKNHEYIFIMNFNEAEVKMGLPAGFDGVEMLSGNRMKNEFVLKPYGVSVIKIEK
ncbi:beta-galactosidase [Heyndrickxia faecalis]|uniref:beta-galactosidase n=1 Tax=Heyndrickxia faecalis TaxID=2824910 RepID=UPI0032B16587